ncbi:MAG: DUF5606 domain-containing protein [Fermentimonas sp.]|nr:DUF5606 domain-containing protein [Fermentimonas sp.]
MLTKILSVAGRPGLYKLISTSKNMNIVESMTDGKRIPVYMHEKIVALSDVSMYTNDGDTPLRDVFKKIKEKENSKPVALTSKSSNKDFFSYLEEVLPDYNKESVYASDVKKLISWYNILMEHNIDLEETEEAEGSSEAEESGESEKETETNPEE